MVAVTKTRISDIDVQISKFFKELTGNLPYDYQRRVATLLLDGQNIILRAPTGGGKTQTAILPFLWAKKQGVKFVDRLIYVLPLRTLATYLYEETAKDCSRYFKVKALPEKRIGEKDEIVITIQTGEQKNDSFFEGDIIFTTVDQCLSSYLNCPVSLPKRIGNINAGALLGSLIVFDEFHLLETGKAMSTAIFMLEKLKNLSHFVVMTATLSTQSMSLLRGILGGETIQLTKEEVLALPSHREKSRTYRWMNKPLDVKNIIDHHKGKRTIVILNTVVRAQQVFEELKNCLIDSETKLFLLHSRFYAEDRKRTEIELRSCFGKIAIKTNVIVVTTQVIEAGIDISADNLHTELAPMNSIIQRAGRCARYEGDRGHGTVWIYELKKNDKGIPNLGPYRSKNQKTLIMDTRAILEQLPHDGVILDSIAELENLDKVHAGSEANYFESYKQNRYSLKKKVYEAMDGRNEVAVRELIRDVASVNVIICPDPYTLRFDGVKWPRMLSIPRSSLYKLTLFFEECSDFEENVAWYPVEDSNVIYESEILFGEKWKSITSKDQIKDVSWLIVINPEFASYLSDLGLQIGVKGNYEEQKYFDRPHIPRYKIKYETYHEHIHKVVNEYRLSNYFYRNTFVRLSTYYNIPIQQIETLAETCCAFHDVGKLSVKWQRAANDWQQFKNSAELTDKPIAHTDYDPEIDYEEKIKFKRLPPHASEGAYSVGAWLKRCFGSYAIAIWTAIARHHGAFTESLGYFMLTEHADEYVKETLAFSNGTIELAHYPDNITQNAFKDDLLCFSNNTEDEKFWPLYAFLVRRLRLADQKSQKERVNENI